VQDQPFSLNLARHYVRSSWIDVWSVKLDYSEPHCAEPNQVTRSSC